MRRSQSAKRIVASLASIIALPVFAQSPPASRLTGDFFVSPQGQDRWSGRLADPDGKDGPFATVGRAREAVRALLKSQQEPRPARVLLRGGTYYLEHHR